MPKNFLQNPPEVKLKKIKSSINPVKKSPGNNLNIASSALVNDMQTEDRTQDASGNVTEKSGVNVAYLDTPIKSQNDKKEYRVIQLENGLTALLIADVPTLDSEGDGNEVKVGAVPSENEDDENDEETESEDDDESDKDQDDEDSEDDQSEEDRSDAEGSSNCSKRLKREEKMAACGLSVGVGSFSDPPEIPGLAHFLEHMVFMGSEKYPQENDFDVFIKKRGGSDNASTECELTTFYFEVQEKHLLSALDRFAQFFIKPLMKKDAITREREAVESEFQMALPSDDYRKEQLFCSFAKSNHPATKFTWGNLVTLRDNIEDEKLYKQVHKFRERHYSAHRMKLSIQARLPLDVLEDYVKQCFSGVPNNELPPDDFTAFKGANSFDTSAFRRIYKIKPIKDICQVELTWSMPSMHDLYKSKPHQYVSWVIGHEGKGSLISYLRKKMWCLDIYSGNDDSGFVHSSMYALFSVSLILTEQGHKHLQEILNAVFAYINMVRKKGPQKRIYDEISKIEETSFRFADEEPPAEYVEDLCENMHYYPPQDYITGNNLYYEYNPEAIQACMEYLTPDDVNIIIFDKKFDDKEFEKVEPWFKTKYTDMEIPKEWVECWRSINPLPEFDLPLPNDFLTDDFSLISIPSDVPKYPTKIYSDQITEVWYRPDPKFRLPECYMNFYIISPMSFYSPKSAALMDLFVAILRQLLIEELYAAAVAELHHQIYVNDKGIVVKVNGFNQKLSLVLFTIAKCIAESSTLVTKELFEVMKEKQIKDYYNRFLKPGKLLKDVRLSILILVYWSAIDKHAAINDVDFHEFQNFVKCFTDHIYIQTLVQGNMTKEDVVRNVHEFVKTLKCGSLLPNTMPQIRVTQIPVGSNYCKVRNFNATDVNSVVTNYYQSGVATIKLSVIIELLIMIMEEPLFNRLRTQEQLGYDVFCVQKDIFGILGYAVTVCTQADKYSTEHVDGRIEAFLKAFNKILNETTVEDLENVKEALTKQKQCADILLKEEVSRNWEEITTEDYMFDRIENELIMIEHIKIDELRDWMNSHTINGSNLRKLSVHVVGASKPTNNENNENVVSSTDKKDCKCSDTKAERTPNMKYPLCYITPPTETQNSTDLVNYITDVEEYKSRLYSYPIHHIAL
ncbi:Nardilysin [Dufourea novaeangliae]|uniref:Nardilysin n=2 Tax=Dufourea novaeangliae TaxID=178035 RepID=A0A154PRS6_DUFNO|nr:Nardilysin [Dufourea novaeangliae]